MYSGQHEQTTDALVSAFEQATGAKVIVRNDDEDALEQQIEQEGSNSPADVFYTENTPPLARLDEKGLLAPIGADELADVPTQDSASDHKLGGRLGASERTGLQHRRSETRRPADVGDRVGRSEVERQARHRALGDRFRTVVTSVAADIGNVGAQKWLEGLKANAGAHQDPDNETLVANVDKGVTQIGLINH